MCDPTKTQTINVQYLLFRNLESLNNNNTMAVMATLDVNDPDSTSRRLSFFVYHPQFNERTGQGTDIAIWMASIYCNYYDCFIDISGHHYHNSG